MSSRVKRTYNLDEATVRQVRELSSEYGIAGSQDAVVELAVTRLYQQALDQAEAERWARAAGDPDFATEMRTVAADLDGNDPWPA